MNYIEISWENGPAKYSPLSLPFSNHQSEPLLPKKPSLTRSLLFNYAIENSTINFELKETPQLLENIQNETILGTKVQYCQSSGNCLYTGFISQHPKIKEQKRVISFKADIFSILEAPPNKVISKDEFPNASQNLGKYSNIIIGNASAGMYEARKVETGKYLAAWNTLSELTQATTQNGTDIFSQVTKEIDPGTGYTYILYTGPDSIIYFNGKGPLNQGALLENPALMFNYLIVNFSDFQIENLEEAENIYSNRDYSKNFFYIDDNSTWLDIFKFYSQSYNSRIVYTREGKLKFQIIQWTGQTPKLSLDETHIRNFKKWKETKHLRKAWFRSHQIDPAAKTYNLTPLDLTAERVYTRQIGEFPQKYLIDPQVSMDVGTRDRYLMQKPLYFYGIEIPENLYSQLELGDVIQIKHRESYFPNQTRLVQVLRLGNKAGTGFYHLEGYDIHEIQGTPFIVREAGHPQNPVIYEPGNPRNPKIWWSN